jgi:ribosomal protein S12 methylthiotransferase accessory factor
MRVEAEHRGFVIQTDQPESKGGENTAPSPFELFIASIGTCAGFYVLAFCRKRDIPTEGIELSLSMIRDEERHMVERIEIAVSLPDDFPEKYVNACVKSAEQCTVKRHLQDPPEIVLTAKRG